MATANDSLNFFILEAGECLERLDATLASAGPAGPNAAEFVRHARTLRGAALMHRLSGMAELGAAVERAGRSLRDGPAQWSPAVAAALVAAVDDMKILLHNLRIWGPNEEARASRRVADLAQVIPAPADRALAVPDAASAGSGMVFLAGEAAETASALEALEQAPAGSIASALDLALGHVRTLRGVAAVHDVPPVADVLEAVERAARSLVLARTSPSAAQTSLFAAGAAVLRRTASDLQSLGRPEPGTAEEGRFLVARDALAATTGEVDRILPISQLFYGDDREDVVSRAPNPPTTPADRFRLEVVSLAEHLQGLVRDAQAQGPGPVPDRTASDLRAALRSVQDAAQSFGERDVADFLATFTEGRPVFDFLTLNAIDDLVSLITEPTASAAELSTRMSELSRGRALDAGIGVGFRAPPGPTPGASARPAVSRPSPGAAPASIGAAPRTAGPIAGDPARTPAPVGPLPPRPAPTPAARPRTPAPTGRARVRTPTGPDLEAFLADGIAGFSLLGDVPLIEQGAPAAPRAAPTVRPGAVPASVTATRSAPAGSSARLPADPAATATARSGAADGGGHTPAAGNTALDRAPAPRDAAPGVVAIETLLYRGESALVRARALRDTLRAGEDPMPEALAELYDLLDLATPN